MDWDRISGGWKEFQGKAKQRWGELIDDELQQVEGKRDELEGKLQKRYGYAKDRARKEVDDWLGSM